MRGSYNVIQVFQQMIEKHDLHGKIDFTSNFCMKQCEKNGVSALVDGREYVLTPEGAAGFFEQTVLPLAAGE